MSQTKFVYEYAQELEMTVNYFIKMCRSKDIHVTSGVDMLAEHEAQPVVDYIKESNAEEFLNALAKEEWEAVPISPSELQRDKAAYYEEMEDRIIQSLIDEKRGK